jgi:hypothetical protein
MPTLGSELAKNRASSLLTLTTWASVAFTIFPRPFGSALVVVVSITYSYTQNGT